jgi:2-keto-4-pentenoate hydratase/2-oxohepta-3-ene-1,7-dioic acid hydratase in catechol pathway
VIHGDDIVPLGMSVRQCIESGPAGLAFAQAKLASGENKIPISSVTLKAPVADPTQIFCVGLNYRDHALASGHTEETLPKEPLIFQKFRSSLNGCNEPIRAVEGLGFFDYEIEQIAVIGKTW